MVFARAAIAGVYVIDLERVEDERGFFARSWCEREFADHGLVTQIAHINVGFTARKGTLRGLHYQLPPDQEAKTVRCTRGAIYDVVVDLRPDSPTYTRWLSVELTAENRRMLYVPEGCAHGYQAVTDNAEMCYHTSAFYAPERTRGVRYDDPAFDIQWPVPVGGLSDADRAWPAFRR